MSHIDSFKHEIVGYFAGLPVYHPLEDINGDFKCTPKQLLIGGGSGEHPALVLQNPLAAVALFLLKSLEEIKEDIDTYKKWDAIVDPYIDDDKIINYYDWKIETYQKFAERCKSASLPNSYLIFENSFSIETWLILGLGEFIYYAMPDLADEIMSQLDKPYERFEHMRYNNILLIPSNLPVYANQGNAFTHSRRNNISS